MTIEKQHLKIGDEIIFSDTGDIDNYVPKARIVKILPHPEDKNSESMNDFFDKIAELMDESEWGYIDGSNLRDRKDLGHNIDENCVYFFET